jgi:hypothetical protein
VQIDPTADREMLDTARLKRSGRPWLHLLSAVMTLAGSKAELLRHGERPWASATFSGTRHTIALRFSGDAADNAGEAFMALLPEHEFELPGQLVADAAITSVQHDLVPETQLTVEVELLLLQDS